MTLRAGNGGPTLGPMADETFFVLGDQLSVDVAPWTTMSTETIILMVESEVLINAPRHLTRTALYVSAMRAFAAQVSALGYRVDYRRAPTFAQGIADHRAQYDPDRIVMNHPRGRRATRIFHDLGVELLPDPFYLTTLAEFKEILASKKRPSMEQFYRSQRRKLDVLMDGDQPLGGRWNFDEENRKPLPRDGGQWPEPWSRQLTNEERQVVDELGDDHPGADALMWWPRTRDDALAQLADAVERIIPHFGPHEDAASSSNWHLAHSRLSVALNLGLLHPQEVVESVIIAHDEGRIPLASAEGFIRQVIGWREWVWAWHQVNNDEYRSSNVLGATESLPRSWRDMEHHEMACLDAVLGHLRDFGWNHHIERLMVLANAATLAGIDPLQLNDWMAENFVDGAEWVMEANVLGMGTYADGGLMSTKPYIAGGNYLKKMTNFCKTCRFAPTERIGEQACPLTNGYWNFLLKQEVVLRTNHRMAPQLRAASKRDDRYEILAESEEKRSIVLGSTAVR